MLTEHRINVLLVDQDAMIRNALQALLEHHGFAVECVDGDAAAIMKVKNLHFGVIVVDVHIDLWREAPFLLHIVGVLPELLPRSVAITASDPVLLAEALETIGVCHIVPKPIRERELLNAIRACLQHTPAAVH